ncbi:hypothetical protein CRG98_043263 [Punica granatum]|uniref:RRM domain-containing protein n=1 Tax=Punica granatum TaxID=22663 RepID=A0A2I0HXA2_PUNGR|nr:hypothetical protein CRG98_043263 [Punica granatum]
MEELDLFNSVGGMDLEEDGSSDGHKKFEYLGDGNGSMNSEHPYGEHPSRTLFVRNINSNVEDSELRALFEQYGDIRTLYTACKHRGFVMISYYDIRAARTAMKALQSKPLRRRKLDIHYSIPKDNPTEKDINQGTLVVFNLDSSVSNEELHHIFGAYGEIKEIRETPHRNNHKFIEFYDVRAAEAALHELNRSDIAGKQIKLEPSRPGGVRRFAPNNPLESEQEEFDLFVRQNSPANNSNAGLSVMPMKPHHVGSAPAVNHAMWEPLHSFAGESSESLSFHHPVSLGNMRVPNNSMPSMDFVPHNMFPQLGGNSMDFPVGPKNVGFQAHHQRGMMFPGRGQMNKCNVGYAFINMTDPSQIIPFYKAFDGKKWEKFNSEKVASLAYARIQGKAALIAHFQNSSLMNEDKRCRPILFNTEGPNAGDQVPFPMGVNVRTRPGKSRTSNPEDNSQGNRSSLLNGEDSSHGHGDTSTSCGKESD